MHGIRSAFMEILEDIREIIDENDTVNIEDDDIEEIITHNYYANSKIIRTVTEYRYKNNNENERA